MPNWVSYWISFSVLGIGILLNLQPVSKIIYTFMQTQPAATATIVAALLGFTGVMVATRQGFKNLIASNNAQAAREAVARAEIRSDAKHEKEEDRAYERRVLASALHGELNSLLTRIHQQSISLHTQKVICEGMARDRDLNSVDMPIIIPVYSAPLFEASVPKLGLLGASITADVVEVFSAVTAKSPSGEPPKLRPDFAAKLYEGLLDTYKDWTADIVDVGSRLSSVMFDGNEDPGPLFAARKARKKAGTTGIISG